MGLKKGILQAADSSTEENLSSIRKLFMKESLMEKDASKAHEEPSTRSSSGQSLTTKD